MVEIKSFGSSSKGNCYLIIDGNDSIVLEAGINPKKMKGIDWAKAQAVLITHEHLDHAKYVKAISERTGSRLVMTQGTLDGLKEDNLPPKHRLEIVEPKQTITIQGWQILPFDVEHDAGDPVGYFIKTPSGETIVFATDTYYIKYLFPGVNHLMIEANYSLGILERNSEEGMIDPKQASRIQSSHFEFGNVVNYISKLDRAELERIYLLHLSDRNSDEKLFKDTLESKFGIPVTVF